LEGTPSTPVFSDPTLGEPAELALPNHGHKLLTCKELVLVSRVGVSKRTRLGLLLEEVRVGNGRENGSLVDNGSVVDLLLDSDGVVDGGGLDGFTLDDGLD
jgi:hypothetical protein